MKRLVFDLIVPGNWRPRDGAGTWGNDDFIRFFGVTPYPTGQTVIEVEARVLPQAVTEGEMEALMAYLWRWVPEFGSEIRILERMRDELIALRRERQGRDEPD